MKLSNAEIINSLDVIKKLSEFPIPVKTGLILLKNIKKLTDAYTIFETARTALISEYTEKDENGNTVPVYNEKGEIVPDKVQIKNGMEFRKAFTDLLGQETELEIEKVSTDSLNDAKLLLSELTSINWLFN
jgi:hypothetical protein